MPKHLLRFSLDNIPVNEETGRIRGLSEELKRADEVLSEFFNLHVVHVDYEAREKAGYSEYCRDAVTQIGSSRIFIKPDISGFFRANVSLPLTHGLSAV